MDSNGNLIQDKTKPVFLLERYNSSTFLEYWKTFGLGFSPVISLSKNIFDKVFFRYIIINFLYDLPFIGKRLFVKQIKMIVPSIKLNELKFARRGGTRPQIVNNTTRKLEMGEAKLTGDKIIFNITPSPGASTCLEMPKQILQRSWSFWTISINSIRMHLKKILCHSCQLKFNLLTMVVNVI